MPIDLHSKDALLNAATTAEKPVAFLVGSPLSVDATGGVPGVTEMLELVRDEVRGRRAAALTGLESALNSKGGAEAYQTAMRWLQGNFSQDAVNRVVRNATLKARRAGAGALANDDGEPADWILPAGTKGLADLVCHESERFPGPILTTNFDPLLSLAIRSFGGLPGRRVLDVDGGVGRTAEDEQGTRAVVHLHGYWRNSDTLHTPTQLTGSRQKLKSSLQHLLRQRTLIVAAYGGWDDIFTAALVDLMNDDEAQLDVIWCFYQNDPARIESDNRRLLERLEPAIMRGRFRAYGGIDCHSIFGEIRTSLHTVASSAALAPISPLPGWERIDAATLAGLAPLRDAEVLRYFDGAVPTWRHASSDRIPGRQVVSDIGARLLALDVDSPSLQLIRAAGGEGKSTALMQIAADAAKSGKWEVLWRPGPNISLSPEQVADLDPAHQWLIVADDADNLVKVISETARRLHSEDRANVDFLLAARDADWRAAGGDRQPWGQWLEHQPDIALRGISDVDAEAVVAAWGRLGADGLRNLSTENDPAKRAIALVQAASDAAEQRFDGSFFGGLLAVRFGEAGLLAHVREFLDRLREARIEGGKDTLFDALLYVAACHGAQIPGIDQNVLADLVGVPRDWVLSRVVRPLGDEAAAALSAGHVFTRHSKVAAAVLVEAEQAFDVDLAEVWTRLVRQTVRTSQDTRVGHTYSNILHGGPKLQRNLPQQLSEDRRKAIAIAAARAATTYKSEWLGCVVDLAKTYRRASDFPAAMRVFRESLKGAKTKVDFAEIIRGYWFEWGVCEGLTDDATASRAADAWLQGLSISDHLNPVHITLDDCKLSCAGLGVAFGKLAQSQPGCPYAKARRAVAWLGRLTNPDAKSKGYFDRYDRDADKIDTPRPANLTDAIGWLTAGVQQAGREVRDAFLAGLAEPDRISFRLMKTVLSTQSRRP